MNSFSNISDLCNRLFLSNSATGILGFGREGRSTYRLLRKYCPTLQLVVADKFASAFENHDVINDPNVQLISGDGYLQILHLSPLIFVSPGIPLFDVQVPQHVVLTSQTDFMFRYFGEKIIAITGTKGKSTTSGLIAHMLNTAGLHVPLAGNIGIPPFDVIEEVLRSDFAVFEVSSHQLQYVSTAPSIALLLNLYPEHLDYYKDVESYYNAKRKMLQFQKQNDYIVLNLDDQAVCSSENVLSNPAKIISYSLRKSVDFGAFYEDGYIYYVAEEKKIQVMAIEQLSLKGMHNVSNCMAALCACVCAGLDVHKVIEGLESFLGLPHRMERIVSKSGRVFINDSIATIPEATLAAIEAFHPVETVVLGGMDRGIFYEDFVLNLSTSHVKNVCFYGDAGKRMQDLMLLQNSNKTMVYHYDFLECVKTAIQLTSTHGLCLMSPAASSYDQFKNFEERGDVFRSLVEGV